MKYITAPESLEGTALDAYIKFSDAIIAAIETIIDAFLETTLGRFVVRFARMLYGL